MREQLPKKGPFFNEFMERRRAGNTEPTWDDAHSEAQSTCREENWWSEGWSIRGNEMRQYIERVTDTVGWKMGSKSVARGYRTKRNCKN